MVYADTVGGEVSIGLFNHSLSGETQYKSHSNINFEDTLGLSTAQDIIFKAYIEHPLPLVPNIKLGYTSILHTGTNLVPQFSWGNLENFTGTVHTNLSLDYTDATLYYEILDNWTEVDAGFTFRSLSGKIAIDTRIKDELVSYDTLIPMLYGKARFNIPSTDVSLQLELNAMALSSVSFYDYELSARYSFAMGLGIEAGYKYFYLKSDTLVDNFEADIKLSGFYASAVWDF